MNTETKLQSIAGEPDAQIAQAAAAKKKMRELNQRVANINERCRDVENAPDKADMLPALIDDAMKLDAELHYILGAYEGMCWLIRIHYRRKQS